MDIDNEVSIICDNWSCLFSSLTSGQPIYVSDGTVTFQINEERHTMRRFVVAEGKWVLKCNKITEVAIGTTSIGTPFVH
jgi:hypothetical protein